MNDKQTLAVTMAITGPEQAPPDDALPFIIPARIGRYRVEKVLGQGGFGLVYLAQDEQLDRPVAVKIPHAKLISRPEDAQVYLAEARTVANLDHPHIVPVHDVGSSNEFPCFMVSKYVDGTDLSTQLKQGRMSSNEAAELVATVAEALHYAHKQGLVHRDVKPGNILLAKNGQPFLVDFGLALREQDVGKAPHHAGTPAYMSPEQARGEGHRVDGRSDIFSLGVVLYELLVGRRPFTGNTRDEILEQVTNQEPRPPRQYDDGISKELERICQKALSKRASERYSTAKDMADDLRHFLAEQAINQQSDIKDVGPGQTTSATPPPSTSIASSRSGSSSTTTPTSHGPPIKIVPKGLRSFDAHDADFFLELLPGPRDRDGLPDSIRFWKTRIGETDADSTFSVGLIYGPSGCGKSSWVKAGLLPHLSAGVIAIYLEATADETETRLLNGLRKRCPALPANLSLKETLAALRRGQGIPLGKKVLIVLDQFEQWLHANKDEDNADLVQALRQCDCGRVQCIVMVRDDFWMAATRFMRQLEVRLVEGQNSAAVDLFPLRHAEKVLAAFGRAFGSLPESSREMSKDQKHFLEQAVAGLAQEGKVISVRLALFAEMMKGKAWTTASLKAVGGTEGVGITFLEETFSAATAPPEHRYHQKAARADLKLLLPETGSDIKGQMRSYAELLEASGYSSRPQDFESLLAILDGELRLITPTDPEGSDAEIANCELPIANCELADGDQPNPKSKIQNPRYYQLTHDYLVHPIREWLTRKQRETRRGRAELRLAERAATYAAKPDSRFLPSWWEWPNILLYTRRKNWSPPERRVMRAADRYHGLRLTGILIITVIAAFTVREAYRRVELRRATDLAAVEKAHAKTLADNVFGARADGVPDALDKLRPLGALAVGQLNQCLGDPQADPVKRLRAAYALADQGETPLRFLLDAIGTAPTAECRNLVISLKHMKERALPELARRADSETNPEIKARYSILSLHLGDPAPAKQSLAVRSDPIHRTTLIHSFADWHGDLTIAAELLHSTDDPAFHSGLCAALGTIAAETRESDERVVAAKILRELYLTAPDGGTHSAAGWALRQWNQSIPAIEPSAGPLSDRRWFVNRQGMTMLEVPTRGFTMETPDVVSGKEVTPTKPIFVVDREVTIKQFRRFIEDPKYPDTEKPQGWPVEFKEYNPSADCPVEYVNWFDAVLYCNWLSDREGRTQCFQRTGEKQKIKDFQGQEHDCDEWRCDYAANGYRLPTNAEWEYAASAVSKRNYCYGSDEDLLPQYAWFVANSNLSSSPSGLKLPNDSKPRSWPGGLKLPNAFGLFDMHGNVAEWCDPQVDLQGMQNRPFAVRGGSYIDSASNCQTTDRDNHPLVYRDHCLGFRVLCSP